MCSFCTEKKRGVLRDAVQKRLENLFGRSWSSPSVAWRSTWLENGFCSDCRLCCGPQPGDDPYPMGLLPSQRERSPEALYMLDAERACLDERGCKALGEGGCRLERADRPVSCGLFPIVLANGGLYLYKICPAVLFLPLGTWVELAEEAAAFLAGLSICDLRCIAIHIPEETLFQRYIFLHRTFPDLG
ncbi:MAG: hypothetical protein K5657_01105 [Desulfovibrio sp.]|nr:hypothetical protein [Desulfovibrio sp.]